MVEISENKKSFDYEHQEIFLPIFNALRDENYDDAATKLKDLHPSDIAELINISDKQDRDLIIQILGGLEADTLRFLDSEVVEQLSPTINTESVVEELIKLESDDAVQFVEDLSEQKIDEILEALPEEKAKELQEALTYPEDSAGRLANKQFVTAKATDNVGDVIDLLRSEENLPQDFYTIFILDDAGKPLSFIPLSRIIRNPRDIPLQELKEDVLKAIPFDETQEEVASIFQKYGLISAPVVDAEGKIIGIITVDDITYVIEEEAEKDLLQLAGLSADSDIFSSTLRRVGDRLPWLFVNLCFSLIVTMIISLFENSIQSLVALAALMPVVASLSGISGSQTLTISVRAIATHQLGFTNYYRVLKKELLTSLANAIIVSAFVFLGSYLMFNNAELSGLMCLAITLTFLISALSGASIPLLLQKFNIDPAVASSAIVLALTDMSSFFIFLGLATMLL